MNIKLIILLSLGVLTLGLLAYIAIRAWRYRHNHPKTLLALLLMLAAGQGSAWAQNTWSVQNISGSTFTVSRTNTSTAETVIYRTVNLSAYAGIHYTAKSDTLIFDVNVPSRSVTVSELSPSSDNAYKYQTGTQRSYRFEVTDQGGFYLAHCTRSLTTGTSVPSSGAFSEKEITIYTTEVKYTDAGYDQSNNPHYINSSSYYGLTGIAPVSYYTLIGAQLRSTLSFDAKEQNNGYQYVQILINNTSTCDNRSGCSDGNPGNISLSRYMAGFDHQPSSANTTYAAYTFPVTSQLNNCNEVNNAWDNGVTNKLYTQKFNTDCRASDGRLILPLDFNTFVVRFNASGGGTDHDEWYAKNVKAHIQAVDATAPTKQAVSVAPGRHSLGDTVYVSVAFSEIVVKTGSPTLSTNWGSLSYFSGSGSNVLTFRGIIPDGASGSLNVTALSVNSTNTVKDLAGNSVSGTVSASGLCTLDASYAWPISYDLAGGSVATPNPASYIWESATFTLAEPTREGYTFTGWTGSNGSTPQTAVTVANHSHAPLTYTANWEVITYTITYDYGLDGVSASNPATYTIETPTFTLANPYAPTGYTFAGWTGTDISTPTSDLTIAQGSTGDRTYTATWNNLWGVDADHDGTTAERAYVITTPEGLYLLASLVNGGNNFSGTFFKLGADIAYSCTSQWNDAESTENNYTSIGNYNSSSSPFRGTFDGCGHTVSGIRIRASNYYKGLFGYISGGTVRNVTISDSRITGCQYVGGIVGENSGGTVENCHATATVAIYSRTNGTSPNYHGGIVGENEGGNATATVVGCTSAATVSVTGNNYGGVVGSNYRATVSRCLALGAVVTGGNYSGPVVGSNSGTVTDCHYRHCTFNGSAQNDLYAVVAGTSVTLAPSGAATVAYPHGGLQFYGSAILCGDTLYAPADATVSLSLFGAPCDPLGYSYDVFAASAGTLSGTANPYTLTMPTEDVTINATNPVDRWGITDGADGTYEHPYVITTPEGLRLLSDVSNDNDFFFFDKYFTLGADIDMSGVAGFRPIFNFCGIFSGNRHTISHLTIDRPGDNYIGLFGHLNGYVQNVTLSDATITGRNHVGAIAGYKRAQIEGCVVLSSTVTGTSAGAIMGYCYDNSGANMNYYHNCTVVRNGVSYTTGIGTENGDINNNDQHNAVEGELFTFDVGAGQWHAIASPLTNDIFQRLDFTDLATGSYDLFQYYENNASWVQPSLYLDRCKGYIYRSATGGSRTFVGLPNSADSYTKQLNYRCSNEALRGFNLVGNPFNQPITFSDISVTHGVIAPGYYTLNPDGTWQAHSAGTIAPGQAFLLQVTEPLSGQNWASICINRPNGSKGGTPSAPAGIAFTVRGNGHEDVAHLLFGEGAGLKKMAHLDGEAPSLSIPQGAQRYAIATLGDSTREVALALQALPGEYTISVGLMGLMGEMGYCHLIDRATGADIDLLRDSTYTFHATGSDANRFTVKLSPSATHYPLSTTHFAHLDGDRLIVEGEGTLEVYDALGRRLFSREANSDLRLPTSDFPGTGVYLLRLAGQSQKIVITK